MNKSKDKYIYISSKTLKILALITLAIIVFLLLNHKNRPDNKEFAIIPTSISKAVLTKHPMPTPINTEFPEHFVKRLYNPEDYIVGYENNNIHKRKTNYYQPAVLSLLDYPNSNLVGMKCLSPVSYNITKRTFRKITNNQLTAVNNLLQKLNTKDKSFEIQILCHTEDNNTFVGYYEKKVPYDYTIVYHIAMFENGKLDEITSFSPRISYPSCQGPLILTKTNQY